MILHFITDEKFADYAIEQFYRSGMRSEIVLVSDGSQLKYTSKANLVKVVNPDGAEFQSILDNISDYKAVVLHGMFWKWEEKVIDALPDSTKLAWVFWGGDLYGRDDAKIDYLSFLSKCLFRIRGFTNVIKHKKVDPFRYEVPIEYFRRIDYCLTDVHEDFLAAKERIGGCEMKELWYNYYSIEDTIGILADERCSGNNVLVGNSCFLEGNHLDVFKALRHKGQDKVNEIIVPLSYGEPWLRNALIRIGRTMFRDFHPLTEFMSRDSYNSIILSCSTVIMGHYRQQAFGNIVTSLWLGSRVYLCNKSPLLAFFKRIGCVIFSFEDDFVKSVSYNNAPLGISEMNRNRDILLSIYGKDAIDQKLICLVSELDN